MRSCSAPTSSALASARCASCTGTNNTAVHRTRFWAVRGGCNGTGCNRCGRAPRSSALASACCAPPAAATDMVLAERRTWHCQRNRDTCTARRSAGGAAAAAGWFRQQQQIALDRYNRSSRGPVSPRAIVGQVVICCIIVRAQSAVFSESVPLFCLPSAGSQQG